MTISSTANRITYAGNGSTTVFPFPYYFLANGDIVVILRNETTGVETLQVITTNYTVSGAANPAGGSVTMLVAPPTGSSLVIYRDPQATQGLDLRENDADPAESHEQALDRLTMLVQRLKDRTDRVIGLTDGFTDTFDATLPSLIEADRALIINPTADGFALGPTADEIADAQGYAQDAQDSADDSAASADLAKEWATNTVSIVQATDYSSKEWAKGIQTRGAANGGSAKDWATYIGGTVDDTEFSAKQYAEDAADSAAEAADLLDSGLWRDVKTITFSDSPYTVVQGDNGTLIKVDTTGGAVSVTLPLISGLNLPFNFGLKLSAGGNTVTANRTGSDTIDGSTSKAIATVNNGAVFLAKAGVYTTTDFGTGTATSALAVTTQTGLNYTATSADDVILCNPSSAGGMSLELPAAASNLGKRFLIKKLDSGPGPIEIGPNLAETMDGELLQRLWHQYQSVEIISDGTTWHVF